MDLQPSHRVTLVIPVVSLIESQPRQAKSNSYTEKNALILQTPA